MVEAQLPPLATAMAADIIRCSMKGRAIVMQIGSHTPALTAAMTCAVVGAAMDTAARAASREQAVVSAEGIVGSQRTWHVKKLKNARTNIHTHARTNTRAYTNN